MKYMGSKSKIKKHIVPTIQRLIDERSIVAYCEPFCGGCNTIDAVRCKRRYELYKQWPYRYCYTYVARAGCARNGSAQKEASAVCFSRFIWEKGYNCPTELRLIE